MRNRALVLVSLTRRVADIEEVEEPDLPRGYVLDHESDGDRPAAGDEGGNPADKEDNFLTIGGVAFFREYTPLPMMRRKGESRDVPCYYLD